MRDNRVANNHVRDQQESARMPADDFRSIVLGPGDFVLLRPRSPLTPDDASDLIERIPNALARASVGHRPSRVRCSHVPSCRCAMTERVPTECGLCPWSQLFSDDETAARKLAIHRQTRHGEKPLDGVVQLDSVTWRERAIEAIRILAARGEDFALYEIHTLGVGEPLNPRTDWGRLSRDVHRLGIAHPVDYALSQRPATKGSSVRKWSSNKTRCESCMRKATSA